MFQVAHSLDPSADVLENIATEANFYAKGVFGQVTCSASLSIWYVNKSFPKNRALKYVYTLMCIYVWEGEIWRPLAYLGQGIAKP